jgi:N-acetylglutamate synthase-like GNAT family acetyltransferase
MNPPLSIRRATVYDLESLKAIWLAMRVPPDNLEKRLTEFQVVEYDGKVNGTIGIQVQGSQALLHSEGYLDFSIADESRELFWERIQKLASNLGVFRIWTQECCPFWLRWGFQPADEELLKRLPEAWQTTNPKWFSLELKNEEAINTALKTRPKTQAYGHRPGLRDRHHFIRLRRLPVVPPSASRQITERQIHPRDTNSAPGDRWRRG